jgi:hypothetical protein
VIRILAILAFLFCCCSLHAQTNIVTIPPAPIISWCAHPANAVPCTNKVTTYTTATLATACPLSSQIVLDGTTSCVASPDSQNNWGVWVGPGAYDYTITIGTNNYGPFYVTEPCVSSGCTLTSPALTSPTITNPTTTGTDTGAEILSSKTLTAPIINGTPTGTGIPTIAVKAGSGGGNYTRSTNSFANVDGTNLTYTGVIQTGWKATVRFVGWGFGQAACSTACQIRIAEDGNAIGQAASVGSNTPPNSSLVVEAVVSGDGNSHTFTVQFQGDGTNNVTIGNAAGTAPQMFIRLEPSN